MCFRRFRLPGSTQPQVANLRVGGLPERRKQREAERACCGGDGTPVERHPHRYGLTAGHIVTAVKTALA